MRRFLHDAGATVEAGELAEPATLLRKAYATSAHLRMDGAGVASKPGKTEKRAAELTAAKSEILRLGAQLCRAEEERDIF